MTWLLIGACLVLLVVDMKFPNWTTRHLLWALVSMVGAVWEMSYVVQEATAGSSVSMVLDLMLAGWFGWLTYKRITWWKIDSDKERG